MNIFLALSVHAKDQPPVEKDTLPGALNPLRSCYDVNYYYLQVKVDTAEKSIAGVSNIYFTAVEDMDSIQVDLFSNYKIVGINQEGLWLKYEKSGNHLLARLENKLAKGSKSIVTVIYSGKPKVSKTPPWDGGFVWGKDSLGRGWIGVACESIGASSWWPCKDHLSDEPDSMRMSFQVPQGMFCVSNGLLTGLSNPGEGYTQFDWKVSYPINLYDVTMNIGYYSKIKDSYESQAGKLNLDYYVLDYNTAKARKHFEQVKPMLNCFEKYFGPYPFTADGYALVETPYWGMEHQSAIAYGNNYKNNAYGFDFIIVHESGHEWWGNSLSVADHAEMWMHESFTTYAEALYVECTQGLAKAKEYLEGQKKLIKNEAPMVGPLNVNYHSKDNDIYYKGTWVLHTLRNVLQNNELWFKILYSFQQEHKYGIVSSQDFIQHVNKLSGMKLDSFFKQYLYFAKPPVLDYSILQRGSNTLITYKWNAEVQDFDMPVDIQIAGDKIVRLKPTAKEQKLKLKKVKAKDVRLMTENFYFLTEEKGS